MIKEHALRGHHLGILKKYIQGARPKMLNAIQALNRNYGNFAGVAASKIDLMISDPENQILITTGLDDICNSKCPYRKENSCQRDDQIITDEEAAKFDRKFIEQFGLQAGKKYSANDLINILNQ